jgi:uncharacterized protein YbjQ (UPF0145 family)
MSDVSGGTGVPQVAEERLRSGSFSSGLTVPDFAACLQMGLQPAGLVQGFCVMQQAWYGTYNSYYQVPQGGYSSRWPCPHGMGMGMVSSDHRPWGQNYEQALVEQVWSTGFGSAYERMLDEARELDAHGVIGVVDRVAPLAEGGALEFHITGTAVRVEGAAATAARPWATYLAGQRLAKLVEAGLMPVAVAAANVSVRVWASCVTGYLMEGTGVSMLGGYNAGAQEVEQITEAHTAVRRLARERVSRQLQGDALHGATLQVFTHTLSEGDEVLNCTLRGTRVRRIRAADPLPTPRPTVRLA